jgi:prepilin-type N-terminal cleavage/methylation domain-containing protein
MRLQTGPRHPEDKGGFTLVEVVMTVVIMGLIIAPLSMAMIQALNLVPQSGARTQDATDDQHALQQWADDVSQTERALVANGPHSALGVLSPTQTLATWTMQNASWTFACPSVAEKDMLFIGWWSEPAGPLVSTTPGVEYYVNFSVPSPANGMMIADLHRVPLVFLTEQPGDTILRHGYCSPGESSTARVDATAQAGVQENFMLTFKVHDTTVASTPLVTSIYNTSTRVQE